MNGYVDAEEKIDELIQLVESARAMPMSSSCVLNRTQVLDLLRELRADLPQELDQAAQILRDRDAVIAEGRREADRIVAHAHEQRGDLVSDTAVSREAMSEADRIRSRAMEEAYAIRAEADEYVDKKLANFEVVLNKTLAAVGRGREKLRGHQPMDELGAHIREQDEAQAATAAARDAAMGYTGELPRVAPADNRQEWREPAPAYAAPAAEPDYGSTGYGTGAYPAATGTAYGPQQPGGYGPATSGSYDTGSFETGSFETGSFDAGGYDQGEYGHGGYENSGGFDTGNFRPLDAPAERGPAPGPAARPHIGAQRDANANAMSVLDETSFFDTSLIDARQFRDH